VWVRGGDQCLPMDSFTVVKLTLVSIGTNSLNSADVPLSNKQTWMGDHQGNTEQCEPVSVCQCGPKTVIGSP